MAQNSTVRRLAWYIARPEGKFDLGRLPNELSCESWMEFKRIVGVTDELRPFLIDYLALENDFSVLGGIGKEIATSLQLLPNAFDFGGVGQTVALAKAQGALSNFLSSASAFRDRSTTRLRERYGVGSLELRLLEGAMKDAYDGSFAYRLLYNLRNFGQHHDSPLSPMPAHGVRQDSGEMQFSVSLVLWPTELLRGIKLNKSFRAELAAQPSEISLMAPSKEYFLLHSAMMKNILDMHLPRLIERQNYGRVIFTKMKLPHGAIPIIWEGEEQQNARFYQFSFDEFAFLRELHERLAAPAVRSVSRDPTGS